MDMIPLIMLISVVIAFILGIFWAKANIHADVSILYSTRPLSPQQIDSLNQELKRLKAESTSA